MKNIYYLLGLIILSSCSHQALVPLNFDPNVDNDPISVIDANGTTVYLENIERKSDLLVFDLEVENNSNEAVEVNPLELYYYAGYDKFEPVHDSVKMDVGDAYGSIAHRIHKRKAMSETGVEAYYEKKVRNNEGLGVFLLVLGAGLIINDVIQDANDSQKPFWTENDVNRSVSRDILTASSLIAIDIAGAEAERESFESQEDLNYVSQEIFPNKIVSPGQSIRGKVFFRNSIELKYYRLIVPVGETDYIFDFRKRKSADKNKLRVYDLKR